LAPSYLLSGRFLENLLKKVTSSRNMLAHRAANRGRSQEVSVTKAVLVTASVLVCFFICFEYFRIKQGERNDTGEKERLKTARDELQTEVERLRKERQLSRNEVLTERKELQRRIAQAEARTQVLEDELEKVQKQAKFFEVAFESERASGLTMREVKTMKDGERLKHFEDHKKAVNPQQEEWETWKRKTQEDKDREIEDLRVATAEERKTLMQLVREKKTWTTKEQSLLDQMNEMKASYEKVIDDLMMKVENAEKRKRLMGPISQQDGEVGAGGRGSNEDTTTTITTREKVAKPKKKFVEVVETKEEAEARREREAEMKRAAEAFVAERYEDDTRRANARS